MTRDQALLRALQGDPAVPGLGRLCQELLADCVGGIVMRPPAVDLAIPKPCSPRRRQSWSDERRAKFRNTIALRRKAWQGIET